MPIIGLGDFLSPVSAQIIQTCSYMFKSIHVHVVCVQIFNYHSLPDQQVCMFTLATADVAVQVLRVASY